MTYSAEVLADTPAGYWRLGESSGSTMVDSSGNSRNGTYASGVTLAQPGLLTGDSNTAVTLNGTSGHATLTSATWMDTTAALTVECIVKTTGNGSGYQALLDRDSSGTRPYQWQINPSGALVFIKIDGGVVTVTSTGVNINNGTPHHLAATYDGSTIRLYIDGSQVGSGSAPGTLSSGSDINVGVYNRSGLSSYFKGTIDEAAYYTKVLSAARIAAHYTAMTSTNLTLTDVPAAAVATAVPEALTIAQPLSLADVPAAATAVALPEALSFTGSLTLTDTPAVGTAVAVPEVLTIAQPLALADAPAAAAAAALPEMLQFGGNLALADIPAVAAAVALPETLTGLDAVVAGWHLDESGTDLALIFDDEPVSLDVTPPAAVPPATITTAVELRRVAYPGMPHDATDSDVYKVESDYGTCHLIVGGRDITWLRDVPVSVDGWSDELPFGEQTLNFQTPQIQPEDELGGGDLAMFTTDAPVQLDLIKTDGTRVHLFSGRLILDAPGHDDTSTHAQWQAKGAFIADADSQQHRAPIIQDPEDIGRIIPRVANALVSRGFSTLRAVTTGILASDRGSWGDKVTGYLTDLLATAWTDAGRQWTIAPVPGKKRTYTLVQKQDPGAPTWTFTLNQPGLTVDAPKDETQRLNVIYGHGVAPNGSAWGNWQFPDISPDDAPPYPNTDAGHTITLGTTDAGTDTGHGVSVWQQGARNLGFDIAVDGVYNTVDQAIVERVQAHCGIQVDGIIGPQTWVATFQTGSNAGDLNNAYRKPLAIDPRVDPWTYAANGAIVGKNPLYDPSIARYEEDVDFGTGITKADGVKSAQQMLARSKDAGRTATIVAKTDPWEGHRLDILSGHKIKIAAFRGNLDTWVVSRDVNLTDGTVTYQCDTKARDAMTLAAIQSRNIAAGLTPSGRPLPHQKASAQSLDTMVQFDEESRAGVIPRLPLFGGLWTVVNVPVSLSGVIAELDLSTDTPAAEFYVALFGSPITPNQLRAEIGNPASEAGDKAWTSKHDHLVDRYNLIEQYGSPDQPCGFSPGSKSDGDPKTGRLLDTNPLNFASGKGGRAWLALYSTVPCFIHGEIRPGPVPT